MLYVFEENEAVINMLIKGRSPTMRHVSRTHRDALDWLFDRNNLDSKVQIRYIDTKHQLADILTKCNFTRDEWNNLLHLLTSAMSALLAALRIPAWSAAQRNGCRNTSMKKEVWQNRNLQRGTCLLMFRQFLHPRKVWLHPKVQGYS